MSPIHFHHTLHTETTEAQERVASREIMSVRSVVSVWGDKKAHGNLGHGQGFSLNNYLKS